MSKFLDTSGVSHYLEKLIKDTENNLLLVSPYLQFSDRIKKSLEYLLYKGKKVQIIFRDSRLQPADKIWISTHPDIVIKICKDLHAKCYINEREAIVTSMNLFETSQAKNYEMGIYVTSINDPDLYNCIRKEVAQIAFISNRRNFNDINSEIQVDRDFGDNNLKTGYCIRTGVPIPFDLDRPLSWEAYKVWSEFMDENYKEKFCHFSGELSHGETSYARPIMQKNWKKAQENHDL